MHCSVPSKPRRLLKRPQIYFSIHASCKDSTSLEIFRAKYYEICDLYQDFCKLYTDRSVIGDQVGSATICGTTTKTVRLPNGVSIFTAELYAITMALNIIYCKKESKFIIFSDSMSSLQTLKGFKLEIDLIYQIIKDYSHLTESGKKIVICWIPSHVNIPGNERGDLAAKSAVTLPITLPILSLSLVHYSSSCTPLLSVPSFPLVPLTITSTQMTLSFFFPSFRLT